MKSHNEILDTTPLSTASRTVLQFLTRLTGVSWLCGILTAFDTQMSSDYFEFEGEIMGKQFAIECEIVRDPYSPEDPVFAYVMGGCWRNGESEEDLTPTDIQLIVRKYGGKLDNIAREQFSE